MKDAYEGMVEELLSWIDTWPGKAGEPDSPRLTARLHPYTHLFSPVQVNGVEIKNRIVMAPMGNISVAEETGRPTRKMVDYFAERAKGGVGLITSGLVPVSQAVDPAVTEPGGGSYFPRINGSRSVFSGWRDIASAVHAHGSHFFIQLTPGLGRVGSPECLLTKKTLPVSASWNPNFYMPAVPCRPLTDGQCRRIIRAAAQAAANARATMIDGVYLHGHEGYLLEQMTNPAFNRRRVGRYADWQAFGLDLVRSVRARVGHAYPIMYRIDLTLALNATYGPRMETVRSLRKFRRERTVAMTLGYMENLVGAGVDIFDVDLGCYDNWWLPHPPSSLPSGCYLLASRIVKEHFARKGVRSNAGLAVPVVAVGKLGYPDLAEQALRDGGCDMVMLGRPLLADAHWADKAFSGRTADIVPCIGDQEACLNEIVEGGHPQCSVNPRTGFEDSFPADPGKASAPIRVGVVGAGPAGLSCALTAARRGHRVVLFEQRDRIGGMLVPGSRPRIKYEVANYLACLEHQVEEAVRGGALEVRLGTRADETALGGGQFDAVVLCPGGTPAVPRVPGAAGPGVVQAVDLLLDPAAARGARRVVVIGGGSAGCECAHFLALELGKHVTVVEMQNWLMKGVCTANRGHLIHALERAGVGLLACARVTEILADRVILERNVSPTVPDPLITWRPLLPENIPNPLARPVKVRLERQEREADLVVLAAGLVPETSLWEACVKAHVAPKVTRIGDAFQIGRVFEAVRAGSAVGLGL